MTFEQPHCDDRGAFRALLTICCLVTFGCYFSVSMRLPVVPLYAGELGVGTARIGAINAAFYLMAGLLALPAGTISDLVGRKRLAVGGAVVLFFGMLLLFWGRSFVQFAGIYLLLGVGMAAFGPTMMSWVAEISPPTHLGRAYGWYTTALFCGLGMGPAAGGALGTLAGYRPVFLAGAGLTVVTVWALIRFLPSGAPAGGGGKPPGGETRLSNVARMLTNRPLIGSWLATFGANIAGGVFFTFMPLLASEKGLGADQIGIVYLVQSVANALARIPFGALSDRMGKRKYQAAAGGVMATVSIAGFTAAQTLAVFVIAAVSLGASLAVAFTAIGALVAETAEPRFRGLAMGGYNSAIYFGLMAGSVFFGPLIESIGFSNGFLVAGAINLLFVLLFSWCLAGYGLPTDAGGQAPPE